MWGRNLRQNLRQTGDRATDEATMSARLRQQGEVREMGTGPTDPTKFYEPLL